MSHSVTMFFSVDTVFKLIRKKNCKLFKEIVCKGYFYLICKVLKILQIYIKVVLNKISLTKLFINYMVR